LEELKNEWKKVYESKDSTAADRLEKMIKAVDIIVLIRDNEELQKFIIEVINSIWKNDEEKN
jgi:UDP-glucose 6-dehydrogenase